MSALVADLADIDVTKLTDAEFFAELEARLEQAQIGSCTCLTKTHETVYHAEECRYRKLSVAQDALRTFKDQYETTEKEFAAVRLSVLERIKRTTGKALAVLMNRRTN